VPARPRVAAFFDYDGTIIAGYSILPFLAEPAHRRELVAGGFLRTAVFAAQSALGRIDSRELLTRGIHEWNGRRLAELEALGAQIYRREFRAAIFPEIRRLVDKHRRKGHLVAIATSAAPFQVEWVARELGIEHVLCTRLEVRKGLLTGKTKGPILWGRAKAEAAREFAHRHHIDMRRSYFYADGYEDLPLMQAVGRPRPTNPHPLLAAEAKRLGWTVLRHEADGGPGAGTRLRGAVVAAGAVPAVLGALAMRLVKGNGREAGNVFAATLTGISLGLGKVRLEVTGEENLWAARPAVFIWNHRNLVDAQIVGRLVRRDFGAVATKELASVPLIAAASRFLPIAFVDRDNTRASIAALAPFTRSLGDGMSMLFAPEGTGITGNGIGKFKKGAFRMAMKARVPIVPIVIRNMQDHPTHASGTMKPGTVQVTVLPPVRVDDWTRKDLERRIEGVRQQFVRTLARWPGESRGRATGRRTK
jgi:putative phosphoserine phosphatase/1-acylglycerol-3-phosphate O-acyltransferase